MDRRRFAAGVFDFLILAFLAIWIAGGIPWGDRLLLKHGADPRRAAILIALAGAALFPCLRRFSIVLASARKTADLLTRPRWRWAALAVGFFWAAILGVLQTQALRYPMWDVGIFHQILWGIANGHGFVSTISGAGNFLSDHLSPSLALLAPVFWLSGSSPLTLAVLHPLLIFGGVAAWVYFAERVPRAPAAMRTKLAAATVVFALCFDSLWANLRWGFHENAMAFATLSWAMALLLTSGPAWLTLSLFLVAAFSKETLLLNVAIALGLWAWEGRKRHPLRAGLLVVLLVALIGAFVAFEKMPHPHEKNYFIRYYSYLGSSLGEFARSLLFAPWKVIDAVGAGEILRFLKVVFLPWLALPLIVLFRRPGFFAQSWLLIIVPSFFSALLATYPPLRKPEFHYVLELWPVLAMLTLVALANLARMPRLPWAWAVLAMISLGQDPWGQFWEYARESRERADLRRAMLEIPTDAAVAAHEMSGTWLASRKSIVRWPELNHLPESRADWVVLPQAQIPEPEFYVKVWSAGDWSGFKRSASPQVRPRVD